MVSTKVGRLIRPGKRTGSEVFDGDKSFYLANDEMCCVLDYSYDGVMRSLEDSLERLGLDRVDILHIHDPDDHFDDAVKGAYKALDKLRSEGTISAVSAGMNQWEMPSRFMDHGRLRLLPSGRPLYASRPDGASRIHAEVPEERCLGDHR